MEGSGTIPLKELPYGTTQVTLIACETSPNESSNAGAMSTCSGPVEDGEFDPVAATTAAAMPPPKAPATAIPTMSLCCATQAFTLVTNEEDGASKRDASEEGTAV